ncbi:MAG: GNAT family N-acetyltransferase [Patescibacteria group bacterium]
MKDEFDRVLIRSLIEVDIDNAEKFLKFINEIINDPSAKVSFNKQRVINEEKMWLKEVIGLINQKKMVQMVVFLDNEVVGMSDVTLQRERKSHVGEFGIALTEKARGRKLGSKLAKAAIEESMNLFGDRLRVIKVSFPVSKNQVKDFYKSLGFIEVAIIPDQYLFDELEAETVMIKRI